MGSQRDTVQRLYFVGVGFFSHIVLFSCTQKMCTQFRQIQQRRKILPEISVPMRVTCKYFRWLLLHNPANNPQTNDLTRNKPLLWELDCFLSHRLDHLISTDTARKRKIFDCLKNPEGCVISQVLLEEEKAETFHSFQPRGLRVCPQIHFLYFILALTRCRLEVQPGGRFMLVHTVWIITVALLFVFLSYC